MRKKWFSSRLAVGLMAASLVVVAGCSNGGDNSTVATVDGEKISQQALNDELVKAYGQATLAKMIDDKIVDFEVKKEKITVSKDEIDEEFNTFVEGAGGAEMFNAALEQNGITEDLFKEDIEQYLEIRKLMEPKIEITDEEIEAFFEENKESMDTPEQVEASHILIKDEKLAKEVAQKLKDGEDFAELAKEHSEDTGSAANGGELGFFPRGKMMPEFEEEAFSMKVDTISDLVKTDYGYHIIHLTDKKEAKKADLKDFKDDIKATIFEEKMKVAYPTWLAEAKEEYKVDNKLEKKEEKKEKDK